MPSQAHKRAAARGKLAAPYKSRNRASDEKGGFPRLLSGKDSPVTERALAETFR
jgi:hypothetical protein